MRALALFALFVLLPVLSVARRTDVVGRLAAAAAAKVDNPWTALEGTMAPALNYPNPFTKAQTIVDKVFGRLTDGDVFDPFLLEGKDASDTYNKLQNELYHAGLQMKAASCGVKVTTAISDPPRTQQDVSDHMPATSAGAAGTKAFVANTNVVIGIFGVKCKGTAANTVVDVAISSNADLTQDYRQGPAGANNIVLPAFGGICPANGAPKANARCGYSNSAGLYVYANANAAQRSNKPCAKRPADSDLNVLGRLQQLKTNFDAALVTAARQGGKFDGTMISFCKSGDKPRAAAIYFDERSICNCCQDHMQNNPGNPAVPAWADHFDANNQPKYGKDAWMKIVMGPLGAARTNPAGAVNPDVICSVPWHTFPPNVWGKTAAGVNC